MSLLVEQVLCHGLEVPVDPHLQALPDALVEAAPSAELDELEHVLREQQPPRGRREGRPATRLLDAVDRARAKGKG